MRCEHGDGGDIQGTQAIRGILVASDTRTIIRGVYAKLRPEARQAVNREPRHAIINAALRCARQSARRAS